MHEGIILCYYHVQILIPSSMKFIESMCNSSNSTRFKNLILSKFYRTTKVMYGAIILIQRLLYTFNLSKFYDPILGVAGIVSLRASAYEKNFSTRNETADALSDKWKGLETANFKVMIVFTAAACLKLFEWIRQHRMIATQDGRNEESETFQCQGASLVQLLSNTNVSSIPPPQSSPRPFESCYCSDCKATSIQSANKVAMVTGHLYCSACAKSLLIDDLDDDKTGTEYEGKPIKPRISYREKDVIHIYEG